jgi:hypothetical protein
MKRFINTPFFCMIKTDPNVMFASVEDEYDAFVTFVLDESIKECSQIEKVAYRNALVYTQTKLAGLLEIPEKKRTNNYKKCSIFCHRANYVCR